MENEVIDWLMDGDPAIRWQTMRDLLHAPPSRWCRERHRTLKEGWGARFLGFQADDGSWGGGVYSPKWTSTTYTLLTLCDLGIPRDHPLARQGATFLLDRMFGARHDEKFMRRLAAGDRCVVGMVLRVAAYFGIADERMDALVANLLSERMPDGAWNCRRTRDPATRHSSFHTTFNVLEGLRQWLETRRSHALRPAVPAAETSALEFMLQHRLFKSDKTGRVIDTKFTLLTYPYRWHYTVLRGLAFFAHVNAPRDERLKDAMELLRGRRRRDGAWPVQHRIPGKNFFDMEEFGGASRWNTLQALKILRWWERS